MVYRNRNNIYKVEDGIVYVYRMNGEYVFCADAEDIPLFDMWSWHLDNKGYTVGGSGSKGKMYKVHRLIMPCPDGMTIDHISRDKSDNRKANLRICSYSENNKNKGLFKNNTSGAKGVFWDKTNHSWRAVIGVNSKNKYLGTYRTFSEAKAAREAAEIALNWTANWEDGAP